MKLERDIQRELTRLDPNLFLDKLYSPFGYIYYVVQNRIGSNPADWLNVVEWRDYYGPLPLSHSIVEQVMRQEGDIREAIASVTANNAAKKELARQAREREQEEIAKEMHKSAHKLGMSGPWAPKHDVWAWSNKKKH